MEGIFVDGVYALKCQMHHAKEVIVDHPTDVAGHSTLKIDATSVVKEVITLETATVTAEEAVVAAVGGHDLGQGTGVHVPAQSHGPLLVDVPSLHHL